MKIDKQKIRSYGSLALGIIAFFSLVYFVYSGQEKTSATNQRVDNCATKKELAKFNQKIVNTTNKASDVGDRLVNQDDAIANQDVYLNSVLDKDLPKINKSLANTNSKISKLNKQLAGIAHQDSIRHQLGKKNYGIITTNYGFGPLTKKDTAIAPKDSIVDKTGRLHKSFISKLFDKK